jgi:hypothetical protein
VETNWTQTDPRENITMKVKELIEELSFQNPEDSVVIVIDRDNNIIGGHSPSVEVKNVWRGFDWDMGTVLIVPESKLKKV